MGGDATWSLLERDPKLFAATALPLAGAGDPTKMAAARDTAVWAFHTTADSIRPVKRKIASLIDALKKARAAQCRLSECDGDDHNCWTRAYADPGVADWLFAQRR